jgi:hypothetical protein
LPIDLAIDTSPATATTTAPGHILEVSPHRTHLLPFYNRYLVTQPSDVVKRVRDPLGWDSLMQVLFETSYMLNRFSFAWEAGNLLPPAALVGDAWTSEQADITDAVVLVFAASGKTALAFAHQLKHARPADSRPRKVVAVTSAGSKVLVEGTGFYDQVLLYDAPADEVAKVADSNTKLVLCDFGSRGDAFNTWTATLQPLAKSQLLLTIGSEPKVVPHDALIKGLREAAAMGKVQVNASDVRSGAMKLLGEARYFGEFLPTWRAFVDGGAIPGLSLEWGKGMEDVGKAWEKICDGKLESQEGLLFEL